MIDFTYKTFDEFVALGDGPDIDDVASARVGWNACMAIREHVCPKCQQLEQLYHDAIKLCHDAGLKGHK